MKKILVTGGAGFIGSHIADKLISEGHEVIIIDNLSTGNRENVNKKSEFHEMDIRDPKTADIFVNRDIDAVYHLAAQLDVRKSVEDPIYDADVNILGGLKLLQNCVKNGVKRFIFASSGGVMYGECPETAPTEEKSPFPLCPYGDSKLALEYYLNFYRKNYGLECVALRFGNVYGPRQDPHGEAGVVAIFSGAMLKDTNVKIFGDGEQLRDYVYVGDVVTANVAALEKGSGIYNIGTGVSNSVNELFNILKEMTEYKKEPEYCPIRGEELIISRLDVSRASRELGWSAELDFKQGLKHTVDWFWNKLA
ncbi:MAG: NAD-dependent epimerase/dehydratase family protein [Elusimicrobiota bacterium]